MAITKNKSIYLYNVVIPILFFEMWNVMLAFLFIVFIEAAIISFFIKINFYKLIKSVFIANLITTIIGYLIQGILRMLIFIPISGLFGFPKFLDIIGGNLSLESYATNSGLPYEIIIYFSISMIIAFFISVHFEKTYLLGAIDADKKRIEFSVLIANIVSYTLLFIWIIYRYLSIMN